MADMSESEIPQYYTLKEAESLLGVYSHLRAKTYNGESNYLFYNANIAYSTRFQ